MFTELRRATLMSHSHGSRRSILPLALLLTLVGESPSQDWGQARLTATSCDWGTGGLDNDPDDLVLWFGPGTSSLITDDVTADVVCVASSSGNTCSSP